MLTEPQLDDLRAALPGIQKRLAAFAIALVRKSARRALPAGEDAGDLVQQALADLTVGKRSWPAGIALEAVLKEVMMSVASHRWESAAAREVPLEPEVERAGPAAPGVSPVGLSAPPWSAEDLYSLRERQAQIMDQVMAAVGDDEVAWKVARCIIDGPTKRSEIAEACHMTDTAVHATLKRLRRRLQHLVPGWRPP